jgi:hypothetical protein
MKTRLRSAVTHGLAFGAGCIAFWYFQWATVIAQLLEMVEKITK